MSDEDRAQDLELAQWEANQRLRAVAVRFEPGTPGYGPAECTECEEKMPAVRRAYGFRVCVECASSAEQAKLRLGGRG